MTGLGEGINWTRIGIEYHLKKVDATGSHERVKGSGSPCSDRADENKDEVEEASNGKRFEHKLKIQKEMKNYGRGCLACLPTVG